MENNVRYFVFYRNNLYLQLHICDDKKKYSIAIYCNFIS